jgi:hypothetical protein
MRRREFISLLGGAAVPWPVAVRAQQGERVRRVGLLMGYLEGDAEGQGNLAAFRQELQELGWTEGRNIRLDIRWGGADPDKARTFAKEYASGPNRGLYCPKSRRRDVELVKPLHGQWPSSDEPRVSR